MHREGEEAKVDRGGLSSVCLLCSTVQVSMDGWKFPKVVRDECAQMLPCLRGGLRQSRTDECDLRERRRNALRRWRAPLQCGSQWLWCRGPRQRIQRAARLSGREQSAQRRNNAYQVRALGLQPLRRNQHLGSMRTALPRVVERDGEPVMQASGLEADGPCGPRQCSSSSK